MMRQFRPLVAAATLAVASLVHAQTTIDVKLDQPGITVSPSLWGIFFEEINRAGEGGIWAELLDNGAIGEAAFMTGMERNSDIVTMSSYAPLFNNVAYTSWSPNAINFDNARVFGSPSYYVQKMFFTNRPDRIVPSDVTMKEAEGKPLAGSFGVGTWLTQAQYKDIKITEDGKTVYQSDFGDNDKLKADGGAWTPLASDRNNPNAGTWKIEDGGIVQSGNAAGPFAMLGGKTFTNATLTLKAKKTGGEEGFLIRFNSTGDGDYMMLNLGGWANTRHVVEVASGGAKAQLPGGTDGSVELNTWHDIKIETSQTGAKCYLDGKLVQDVKFPRARSLYVVSGTTASDAIVKVVNGTDKPQPATLNLTGKTVNGVAKVTTLTGEPNDENTLDEPEKIVPKDAEAKFENGKLDHTFPPYSVTVIRAAVK